LKITVLVTTYARREYLERCVASLVGQSRPPDQVVLVMRDTDLDTKDFVREFTSAYDGPIEFSVTEVAEPGVLAANRAGISLVKGEILCFIDDDATARPGWISTIESRFAADPRLGALGGRDLQHTSRGIEDEPAREIGRIRWYGRIIGNHHCRLPGYHQAEVLKGCNMSFRRELISGFDERIIGNAHYYEMDLCLGVLRSGYEIKFDGDLVVDHYVEAPRHLPGNKTPEDPMRHYYLHHNQVYVMLKHLSGPRKIAFLCWSFGTGLAAAVYHVLSGKEEGRPGTIIQIFKGKLAGLRSHAGLAGAEGRKAPGRIG